MFWVFPAPGFGKSEIVTIPNLGDYEIYSVGGKSTKKKGVLLKETPRNALNEDGLAGYFVSETADRLEWGRMLVGARFEYHDLTSRRGVAYHTGEEGSVNTLAVSINYLGEWAEWAATIPMHRYSLSAPKTYSRISSDDNGLGNMRFGWKATYLPDRSYYRFAYGAVAYVTTGNPDQLLPAGSKNDDELKIYGCVTTKETDYATANLELGTILDSAGADNRFIYRVAASYEASEHASLIGELVGEVQGGADHDTMDIVTGIRLSPTEFSVLEFSYTKNLRTYREYGWDDRWEFGTTIRW